MKSDGVIEPPAGIACAGQQGPAMPAPDGTGGLADFSQMLGQSQMGMRSQYVHRNTTTLGPHCQAAAVSAGKGRP